MTKINKPRRIYFFILLILTLLVGVLAGAILQKAIGVGNVLRMVGIPYPTTVSQNNPYIYPSVEIPSPYRGRMFLFILAGQSNMVGWAPLPEEEVTDPRVYVFGNDYLWRIARDPIDQAQNQVDKVSADRIAAYGPSLAFALALRERHPQTAIGLIPCAKNSSAIAQWQRSLSDQTLYGSCLKRARAASPMGLISGILFFQGETDAQDPILYPFPEPQPYEWAQLFTTFVTDFRNDLQDPEIPIVFAQIGPDPLSVDFPNWKVVQQQQSSIDIPKTVMITTDDLSLLDGLHFTADSYRTIGIRFSEGYWDLIEQIPAK